MIVRPNETARCYGMEINLDIPKVMRISWQPSPTQKTIDQKQPDNVEYFNYWGSMITNSARCTRQIKSGIAMA
jgi:hypothetical protein